MKGRPGGRDADRFQPLIGAVCASGADDKRARQGGGRRIFRWTGCDSRGIGCRQRLDLVRHRIESQGLRLGRRGRQNTRCRHHRSGGKDTGCGYRRGGGKDTGYSYCCGGREDNRGWRRGRVQLKERAIDTAHGCRAALTRQARRARFAPGSDGAMLVRQDRHAILVRHARRAVPIRQCRRKGRRCQHT